MEYYQYLKSLHLIFVITWFAGLFYIPRLFIYHIEANSKAKNEKEMSDVVAHCASVQQRFQLVLS